MSNGHDLALRGYQLLGVFIIPRTSPGHSASEKMHRTHGTLGRGNGRLTLISQLVPGCRTSFPSVAHARNHPPSLISGELLYIDRHRLSMACALRYKRPHCHELLTFAIASKVVVP